MKSKNDQIKMERFKIFIDDIRYTKRQQWIITYYILLFHFGLFSLLKIEFLSFLIVLHFSLFTSILATVVLLISYLKLKEYRINKDELARTYLKMKTIGEAGIIFSLHVSSFFSLG